MFNDLCRRFRQIIKFITKGSMSVLFSLITLFIYLHPNCNFPSHCSSLHPFLPVSPSHLPSLTTPFLPRKGESFCGYKLALAYQFSVRLSASSPRQGSSERGKGSKGRQESQKETLLVLLGILHEVPPAQC